MKNPEFNLVNQFHLNSIARGVSRFGVDAFDTSVDVNAPTGPTPEQLRTRRRKAAGRMKSAKVAKASRRRNRAA